MYPASLSSSFGCEKYLAHLRRLQQRPLPSILCHSPSASLSRMEFELLRATPMNRFQLLASSWTARSPTPPDIASDNDDLSLRNEIGEDVDGGFSTLDDEAYFHQYSLQITGKAKKNEAFPIKLYRIIHESEKNGDEDIISFSPSGLSVMIHKPDEFVAKIMPKYFTSHRLSSFQRQLNLYGFRRRMRGADKRGFYHEDFIKNCRNRCLQIKRKVQCLKIPPHLLENRPLSPSSPQRQSCREAPAAAAVVVSPTSVTSPPTYGKPAALSSPNRRHQMEGTPFQSLGLTSRARLPTIDLTNDVISRRSTFAVPPSAYELLEIKRRIAAAKHRAAVDQQLALSALEHLFHYNV